MYKGKAKDHFRIMDWLHSIGIKPRQIDEADTALAQNVHPMVVGGLRKFESRLSLTADAK